MICILDTENQVVCLLGTEEAGDMHYRRHGKACDMHYMYRRHGKAGDMHYSKQGKQVDMHYSDTGKWYGKASVMHSTL